MHYPGADFHAIVAVANDTAPSVMIRDYNECMVNRPASAEWLFEVMTPLGFWVRVTHRYWELIATIKHPVIAGRESDIKATLTQPDEIRLSRKDQNVYLFYRQERVGRWVCAVTRRLNGEGFLITAYPTDTIKEGNHLWPK